MCTFIFVFPGISHLGVLDRGYHWTGRYFPGITALVFPVYIVAPSPTMRNRTKSFRDILLFIVDQNLLSVGDGLRSHPSLQKHRKNCEKEIMDNMQ